MAMQGNLRAKE
uniref:Uncharacterized protein n=1 Tax=Anguilla anguilla TaxID=7936 RepID=A0A0E9UDR3_ANGAN